MTPPSPGPVLVRLSDTDLTLAHPHEDIRGRRVTDRHGNEIGHVSALLIDPWERRVRLLQIGAGGFLGLGERHLLVPVEAVRWVGPEEVQIDRTRDHVVNSPAYDPTLRVQPEPEFWAPYYGHYGVAPFWGAGYPPPPLY